ncbi:alternate-type signal peptide domain-containing protein [Cellulomonas sp. 179-A 9B4 NHS]|uniref:alternate-type signal peptide domain-containing protein n=1 Tax=Cellulomonas sp. 179-A 9B4 NHS TaxID=3142379 RepID=UPI0039A03602
MNNKTKGIIAGAAGIALLAGGATFATWSDTVNVGGGEIESGKLDVAIVNTPQWFDVSADRADGTAAATPVTQLRGHQVDLSSWKIVPGDAVEATYAFDVALEGDNLAAQLRLANINALATNGGTATYKVYTADATSPTGYRDISASVTAGGVLTFVGADAGTGLKNPSNITVNADATADVYVVVTVGFDANLQENQNAIVAAMNGVGVSLTQVRGAADVAGF